MTETAFQRANRLADAAKASHADRMSALVEAHAARHPLHFDNGYGAVDSERVEMKARRSWWKDSTLWRQGVSVGLPRPTERQAVENVRGGESVADVIRWEWQAEKRVIVPPVKPRRHLNKYARAVMRNRIVT